MTSLPETLLPPKEASDSRRFAGMGKFSGATNISRGRPAAPAVRYSISVNETVSPGGQLP